MSSLSRILLSLAFLLAPTVAHADDDDPPEGGDLGQGTDEEARNVFEGVDEEAAKNAVGAAAAHVAGAVGATPCPAGASDKVVFGASDLDAPVLPGGRRFQNFRASPCAGKTGWPTNVHNETTPGYAVGKRPVSRQDNAQQIELLVIHETGGPQGYTNGHHLVHFLIDKGGNVFQLMDLAKWSSNAHNTWLDKRSISIEIANGLGAPSFRNFQEGECPKGYSCAEVNGTKLNLMIPPDDQLQSLQALVAYLVGTKRVSGSFTVDIPSLWLPTEYTRAGRFEPYALLGVDRADTTWYHVRENPCSIAAADRSRMEQTLCTKHGGVLTHSVVNGNYRAFDGTTGGLYTWLRARGRDHRTAKQQAICLLETEQVAVGADKELASWFKTNGYRHGDLRMVPTLDCTSPGAGPKHAVTAPAPRPSAPAVVTEAPQGEPEAPATEEPSPREEPAPEEPQPEAPSGETPSGGDTATGEVSDDE